MPFFPYALSRRPVYAKNGMVATSQPLAAQAGLFLLHEGGNAVDAAVGTAAALTVLEPAANGIGGDAFALMHVDGTIYGLNASGRAPASYSADQARRDARHGAIPRRGWPAVTVPGVPRAWADLHARFGRLPFDKVLAPAVRYAREGYPLSPVLAEYWQKAVDVLSGYTGPEFAAWHATFLPQGFTPRTGALWRSEAHARTLEAIGRSRAEDFYEGEIARRIDAFARETGGHLRQEDLARHHSEWVQPLCADYKGHEVWEIPPNTQAIATLQALNILRELELPPQRDAGEGLHLQIEAMKLAFADARAYVADPDATPQSLQQALLSDRYAHERRQLIGDTALRPGPGTPPHGDTVYLATADAEGMMVSFIQSNYMDFGSGIVVPDTGIALQNRGHNFTLEAGHPNAYQPGKRPYHTIMPGFLTRGGEAVGPFGVMGGFMQPQGHLQVVLNTVDYGMDPQAALDAPRWLWTREREIHVEHAMPAHLVRCLQQRGHEVNIATEALMFGRGQIIWRHDNGVLEAGSDSRADGCAAGF